MTRRCGLALLLLLPGIATSARAPAPDFTAQAREGGRRTLSDFRGQVVVLNFWATWCAPCRAEIPWLQEIHDQYKERGFTVVGVAMDEQGWRAVTPFLAQYGVTYPVLLGNASIARLYGGLETLPRTLFLDRAGRIVASHEAILSKEHLDRIVRTLLSEAEAADLSPEDVG